MRRPAEYAGRVLASALALQCSLAAAVLFHLEDTIRLAWATCTPLKVLYPAMSSINNSERTQNPAFCL